MLVKGGFWVSFLRISESLIRILKLAILTHMLTPEDFGLFGIAMLTLSVVVTFSNTGFKQALIQKKDDIESYLNTAWTVSIIRRILSAGLIFLFAPYVADFFDTPKATPVIQAIGGVLVIRAFINVADVYMQKEMNFKVYFLYNFLGTLAEFIFTIIVAYFYGGVWALVAGYFFLYLTKCITSYIILSYRPNFEFNWNKTLELFEYGKWILGSSILAFIASNLDNLLVGKYLGAAALGFYQVAFKMSYRPAKEISGVLGTVLFPYFSNIQDNLKKLKEFFSWTLSITMLSSALINTGIILLADDFTTLFLPPEWTSIIIVVQCLAIACYFSSIKQASFSLFKGKGIPKYITYVQLIMVFVLASTIVPLMNRYGLMGIALSVVCSEIVSFLIWLYFIDKAVEKSANIIKMLLFVSLSGAICMALGIIGIEQLIIYAGITSRILALFLKIICGVLLFVASTHLLLKNFLPQLNYKIILNKIFESINFPSFKDKEAKG